MNAFRALITFVALVCFAALTGCEDQGPQVIYLPAPGQAQPADPDISIIDASRTGVVHLVPGQKEQEGLAFRPEYKDGKPVPITQMVIESGVPSIEKVLTGVVFVDGANVDLNDRSYKTYTVSYDSENSERVKLTFREPWVPAEGHEDDTYRVKFSTKPDAPKVRGQLVLIGLQPAEYGAVEQVGGKAVGQEFVIDQGFELPIVTTNNARQRMDYLQSGESYSGWEFSVLCPASNVDGCHFKHLEVNHYGGSLYDLSMMETKDWTESYFQWDGSGVSSIPNAWIAPGETHEFYFRAKTGDYSDMLFVKLTDMTFVVNGIEVNPIVGSPCNGVASEKRCLTARFHGEPVDPQGVETTAWIQWSSNYDDLVSGKGNQAGTQVITTPISYWSTESEGLSAGMYYYRTMSTNVNGTTEGGLYGMQVKHICDSQLAGLLDSCEGWEPATPPPLPFVGNPKG